MSENTPPKKNLPKIILAIVVIGGSLLGYQKYQYATTHEDTDNAQVEANFVPILPRMAGFVNQIYVKDYDHVKKGQLLVEIDTEEGKLALSELEVDFKQAQIEVENAKANLKNLEKGITAQQAQVKTAEFLKNKSERDHQRNINLAKAQAITNQQIIDSKDAIDLASIKYFGSLDELISTKSKKAILESVLHRSENTVKMKDIKIAQQKLKLNYAKIYAPNEGRIGKKAVEVGQFIQVSQPLMTIIDDTQFWVVANFKETQVKKLKPGMLAEIKIDAFPDQKIMGRITAISESTGAKTSMLPPDNSSGNFVKVTQRVPVKIEIQDAVKYKEILRAGLSLEVSIPLK